MEWIEEFTFPNDEAPETIIFSQKTFLWRNMKWYTQVKVKPTEDSVGCYFGHYTDSTLPNDWSCSVKYKYIIVDESGLSILEGQELFHTFQNPHSMQRCDSLGYTKCFKYSDIKSRVSTFPNIRTKVVFTECHADGVKIPHLGEIARMFMDTTTADVIIKVDDGGCFPAHKLILNARSEVFKTMLYCGMQESVSGEVLISDVDSATVEAFLRFVYTNMCSVAALDSKCSSMFTLAHLYQIYELVDVCVTRMTQTISNQTVFHFLSLALKYELTLLKDACLKYVKQHKEELFSDINVVRSLDESLLQTLLLLN